MRSGSLALAAALVWLTPPAVAQDEAPAAQDSLYRLDERLSAANSMGFDGKLEQARQELLSVAEAADALAASLPAGSQAHGQAIALAGAALFYTAQNHDPEWGDAAGQAKEVDWLTGALSRLETARGALGAGFANDYEYRGVAGQLWQHGQRLDDPHWIEWSAARVTANRLRLAAQPDSLFETNMVAEALYDHGWMTSDKSLIAEANALAASIPEDELDYAVRQKRDAVARGEAPYDPPGT